MDGVQPITSPPAGFPVFEEDLYSPQNLADPYPCFRRLRDMGDIVWLSCLDMFAVGRFADVQNGLRANDVLISSQGITTNRLQLGEGTANTSVSVVSLDGEEHARIKRLLMKPLIPKALQAIRDKVEAEADAVVRRHCMGEEIDGMSTLASHLPTTIVADLVGLHSVDGRQLLRWAASAFDSLGPPELPSVQATAPMLQEYFTFLMGLTRENVTTGGWAASLFNAADRGEISIDTARLMIFDYATPALDTTILSTGEMLWQLATVEGAFETVKANPELVPSVVLEAVRMATPIRGFTRFAIKPFAMSETILPAGARLLLLNPSANRDERHYADPDLFDVRRNPRDHLGWGAGVHLCAGMHLARMLMEALLHALIRSVARITVGEPTRLLNNGIQGFARLPLTLHPA